MHWFIEDLYEVIQCKKMLKEIELVDTFSIIKSLGTKEGNSLYEKWRRNKVLEYKDIKEYKEKTVFERLKDARKFKTKTLFERLKEKK